MFDTSKYESGPRPNTNMFNITHLYRHGQKYATVTEIPDLLINFPDYMTVEDLHLKMQNDGYVMADFVKEKINQPELFEKAKNDYYKDLNFKKVSFKNDLFAYFGIEQNEFTDYIYVQITNETSDLNRIFDELSDKFELIKLAKKFIQNSPPKLF